MSITPSAVVSGTFTNDQGNPVPNITLTFTLAAFSATQYPFGFPMFVNGFGMIGSPSVTAVTNGAGFFTVTLWGNDVIQTANGKGSYYTVSSSPTSQVFYGQYQFLQGGNYNLLTATPLVPFPSQSPITVPPGSQSANLVFAGPTSGTSQPPAFRALVDGDLPGGTTGSGSVVLQNSPTFTGVVSTQNLESILYADQFPGADMGAKINAAVTYLVASAATYGKIMIPAGNFNVSTTIGLASGCFLEGCGSSTTFLNWVGSSSGVMVDEPAQSNGWGISHLQLQTTSSGGTATAIKMAACNNVLIDDVIINGAGYATGWGTGIYVTGDGSSATSNSVQIRNCRVANYSVAGIQVDHAIDLFVTDCTAYAGSSSDTTAINILCDSGISGAYFKNISTGNGKNGLKVQSSFGGSSATYNGPPWAMFFTDCLFDSLSGGDGILFDSSLGANVVDARFCDCWVASSVDHNVHISGGQKINWQGGTIRAASLNGVLIDSANVDYVTIDGAYITSNNTSATSNTNGVTISAAASNVSVVNSFIGNITEPFGGGSQSYGVYVSANAPNFVCVNNNLTANSTGPLYTTSTATQLIAGNLPVTVPNQNNGSSQWFWVIGSNGFQLVDHTATYVNFDVTDAGVVTARSGLVAPTGTYTGATPTVSSGQVGFGVSTASTASGGSATLPVNPVGFLEVNISGTTYKLPYYAV